VITENPANGAMRMNFNPKHDQCLERADHARRRAHLASDVRERAECLELEQRWLGLAASYALSDRISLSTQAKASARPGSRILAGRRFI
jgi:hypothetical protein